MNDKINEFMIWAEENGWTITKNEDHQLHLAGSLLSRYKDIPIGNINNPVDGHDRSIDRTFCFLSCWL